MSEVMKIHVPRYFGTVYNIDDNSRLSITIPRPDDKPEEVTVFISGTKFLCHFDILDSEDIEELIEALQEVREFQNANRKTDETEVEYRNEAGNEQ